MICGYNSSQLLAKKKWEVLLVVSARDNRSREWDLFWHLVCVAATTLPVGWGDLRLFRNVAVVCHRFKWHYFWVWGFVLLLMSQIVWIIIISEQVGSTKVQFIILKRESIILRHSQSSGGADFLWCVQSSCESNYTWAVSHTEILDKSLSTTSHFTF